MSALEEIQYCMLKIEAMLAQDFMTNPVREILTDMLARLSAAAAELGE